MIKKLQNSIRVPYVKSVCEKEEINAVVDTLKKSTQMGKKTEQFEKEVSKIFGFKYGVATNSGSSSLYISMECFGLPEGSEVITPALTFSTTVGCIVKNNLVPVFIDSKSSSRFVIDENKIESMITANTKAMCIPNLMGNMPDWEKLKKLSEKYKLLILEDSADLIGSNFNQKLSSEYADITITSFYGAHMITCAGNGGMLMTNNKKYYEKAKLLRSWGRTSALINGVDEAEKIENRFNFYLDNIRYDGKFIFEEIGYMLEPSEIGSAYGLEQIRKLNRFTKRRKEITESHLNFFSKYSNYLELPNMSKKVDSTWFAFPLIVTEKSPFTRTDLQIFLEKNGIQTRVIFTGNILRQPAFKNIKKITSEDGYPIADRVMERGLLIANHHGLTDEMTNYLYDTVNEFFRSYSINQ
tara:strand:- start:80 stop:1315 length:1236 start_codon:yes stop_codon:yes gene_type:complete